MLELLSQDTNIWVAFSFVVFVLAGYFFGRKAVAGALDAKIAEIKAEIENAEALKAEAHALLADFQAKQADAQKAADEIIAQAKAAALAVQQNAEAELDESIARREAQLADRLKRIEERAIAEMRNHAADLSIEATREIISKTMDTKSSGNLIDQAVQSVTKYLN
ncbi:MAG: hypothetical protein WC989_01900 [Micavibrio sp.]